MNGNVWIGEPDAHHDSAPVEVAGAGSSQGEIYDDRVRPYNTGAPEHASLVEDVWGKHPERGRA